MSAQQELGDGALDPTTPAGAAHVAALARLELSPAELTAAAEHFRRMLGYVGELDALELAGVPAEPDAPPAAALRADEPRPSLAVEAALANAPKRGPEGFLVPAVLASE